MRAWAVRGIELPFGDAPGAWWIDASGSVHDRPIAGAGPLPGRFFLPGLVDAHAHPAVSATDVTGSVPAEVALLARLGLDPKDALAAASVWPCQFLGAVRAADIVTYHHDPRHHPGQPANPATVIAAGIRLR